MSTEGQLYRDNVPHGNNVLAYDDWSASQAIITVTAGASKVMYISSVDFIVDDAATITAESFIIADSGTEIEDIEINSTSDFMKLFALADKSTFQIMKVDATNEAFVGELRFNPPVTLVATGTFTITPHASLAITGGDVGVHLVIRGWEDEVENA